MMIPLKFSKLCRQLSFNTKSEKSIFERKKFMKQRLIISGIISVVCVSLRRTDMSTLEKPD